MIGSKLASFANEANLKNNGDIIYGIADGYEVSIFELDNEKTLFVDFYLPEDQQLTRDVIRKFINDSSTQYAIQSSSLSSTGIKIVFQNKSNVYDNMKEFFYTLIYFLKAKNVPGADTCTNCGKHLDSYDVVSVQGCVHTCCPECAEKITGSNRAAVLLKSRKNIFIGGIGALFGALVGTVLWVFVAYNGYFALWAGVLIALLARLGYMLFGGKSSVAEIIYNILFSIIGVGIAEFLSECIALYRNWISSGFIFKISEVVTTAFTNLLSGPKYYLPYLEAVGIGSIFALLTVLALIGVKKRSSRIFTGVERLAQ